MAIDKHYIAIEGVIGIGKTTLARSLAGRLDARLLLEEIEENPFLDKFYRDMKSNAFQTQMFFLLSRFRQQQKLLQPELFYRRVITDYHFCKDRIFALLTLSDAELAMYENVYKLLVSQVPRPDILIYLQADTELIMERLRQKGRPFEQDIDPGYIDVINEAYNHYYANYTDAPLLIVNVNDVDFMQQEQELAALVAEMEATRYGTRYYVPKIIQDGHNEQKTLLP